MRARILHFCVLAVALAAPAAANATIVPAVGEVSTSVSGVYYYGQSGGERLTVTAGVQTVTFSNPTGVFFTFDDNCTVALHHATCTVPIALDAVRVSGGPGNDHLRVTGDQDVDMYGDDGDDVLTTGSGDDNLLGGSGSDVLSAGAGDDQLQGDGRPPSQEIPPDGADRLGCGLGDDMAWLGANDLIAGCETVFPHSD